MSPPRGPQRAGRNRRATSPNRAIPSTASASLSLRGTSGGEPERGVSKKVRPSYDRLAFMPGSWRKLGPVVSLIHIRSGSIGKIENPIGRIERGNRHPINQVRGSFNHITITVEPGELELRS